MFPNHIVYMYPTFFIWSLILSPYIKANVWLYMKSVFFWIVKKKKKVWWVKLFIRVLWILKALWIVLSETINILRKLHETNISGMPPPPPNFFMVVIVLCKLAPSSGHALLNLNLPCRLILRRFWGCFLMSGVRMLYLLKVKMFIAVHVDSQYPC